MLSTTVFAVAFLWWAWRLTLSPDYWGAFFPAMVLSGIGVGPTIPNIFTAGVASLSPARYATGSAILSMSRQIGAALGVAIFVAVLGTPAPGEVLDAFRRGWVLAAALSLSAGLVCVLMTTVVPAIARRRRVAVAAESPG
jgi:hypothetical protein